MLNLMSPNDVVFPQHFHGVDLIVESALDEHYRACRAMCRISQTGPAAFRLALITSERGGRLRTVRSFAKYPEEYKVVGTDFALARAPHLVNIVR